MAPVLNAVSALLAVGLLGTPASALVLAPAPAPAPDSTQRRAEVVYVSDGDTLGVRLRGQDRVRAVRLLGVDTPETKDPRKPVQCGGPAASRALTRLLPRGATVTLVTDPAADRYDRYNRLIRYVETATGTDVAAVLLRRGLARVYVYDAEGVRFDRYRTIEARARAAARGSWGHCPDFSE